MLELIALFSKFPSVSFIFQVSDEEISVSAVSRRGADYGQVKIKTEDFDEFELVQQVIAMMGKEPIR